MSEEAKEPQVNPEDPREKAAVVMLIKYYPDTQDISVGNGQNLTRNLAEILVARVLKTYEHEAIGLATARMIAQLTAQKKEDKRIVVPGQR